VLTKEQVSDINSHLLALRNPATGKCLCNDTTCTYNGLPVAVALARDFEPQDRQKEVMASFAQSFLETWPFKTCSDGILYVIGAKSSPKIYRHFGETAQAVLGEKCMAFINSSTYQMFEEEKFTEAIQTELTIYQNILAGKENCEPVTTSEGEETLRIGTIIGIIGIILIVLGLGIIIYFRIARIIYFRRLNAANREQSKADNERYQNATRSDPLLPNA